jgi:hypothetical protein
MSDCTNAAVTHADLFTMNEFRCKGRNPLKYGFKVRQARLLAGPEKEGQLKERSEGVQAQWQTALGVVVAAGS